MPQTETAPTILVGVSGLLDCCNQAFRLKTPLDGVNECYQDLSPTIRHNPIDGFQVSLLIKLQKLDWGSILDNKSDGHAR